MSRLTRWTGMSEIMRTTGEGTGVAVSDLATLAMSEADWHRADLSGLTLDGLSFDGAALRNAYLRGVQAANASFAGANAIMALFRGAVFLESNSKNGRFRHRRGRESL